MAEWLKAHAWKACIGETLSRFRIPLSPPFIFLGVVPWRRECPPGPGLLCTSWSRAGRPDFSSYRSQQPGNPSSDLAAAVAAEQPSHQSLRRIEQEYSLAAELNAASGHRLHWKLSKRC